MKHPFSWRGPQTFVLHIKQPQGKASQERTGEWRVFVAEVGTVTSCLNTAPCWIPQHVHLLKKPSTCWVQMTPLTLSPEKFRRETLFLSKSSLSLSVTTTPPWDCFVPVLPQPLLLQLCTFLTESVRKETGNSSHPHSSCAIPPLLLQWRRLALVTRGQELSHSEGQEDRSVFMPLLGWGSCWGYLLSSLLYCFSFRSSFYNAEPKHPVLKTSNCLATEELMLWCISLRCKTILLIQ